MSSVFLNQGGVKAPPNPANIQKLLDENTQLIMCIAENQNKGNAAECISYQQVLHRNLVYLATIADYNQQNMQYSAPYSSNQQTYPPRHAEEQGIIDNTIRTNPNQALSLGGQLPPQYNPYPNNANSANNNEQFSNPSFAKLSNNQNIQGSIIQQPSYPVQQQMPQNTQPGYQSVPINSYQGSTNQLTPNLMGIGQNVNKVPSFSPAPPLGYVQSRQNFPYQQNQYVPNPQQQIQTGLPSYNTFPTNNSPDYGQDSNVGVNAQGNYKVMSYGNQQPQQFPRGMPVGHIAHMVPTPGSSRFAGINPAQYYNQELPQNPQNVGNSYFNHPNQYHQQMNSYAGRSPYSNNVPGPQMYVSHPEQLNQNANNNNNNMLDQGNSYQVHNSSTHGQSWGNQPNVQGGGDLRTLEYQMEGKMHGDNAHKNMNKEGDNFVRNLEENKTGQ